jgi:nitrate reductase assembly molybdenum cofactor insertion protein NarJ
MNDPSRLQPEALAHLRRAAEWRLLALALECPSESWQAELDHLAAEVDDASLRQLPQQARAEAAPELYHSLFGPGGPAPPREISYARSLQPGQAIADIQAFYDAFAYQPALDEPPDHIAVELGFLGYLHLKAAYALSRGDAEQAATAAEAVAGFTARHVSTLAAPLAKLLRAAEVGYLATAAAALLERVPAAAPLPQLEVFDADSCECGIGE